MSGGGGGGGRSIEQSKALSGTGGYVRAYAGLGLDLGGFSLGANLSRMKFRHSSIDGTQANLFVEIPYTYLTGAYARRGQTLSAAEAGQVLQAPGENMLTLVLDNFRQIRPEGSYKGTINVADLQYAHFFAPDTYWYAGLGVGYHGRPLYNQMLGGVGQRLRLSQDLSLYAQLGLGSGGYAPEVINTGSGLLVYPKVSAEYALTKDLGLSLSAGYLVAPKGSSKNQTVGLALTQHLRTGLGGGSGNDGGRAAVFRGFRVSVFQQTETRVRYNGSELGRLPMLGVQVDAPINDTWYIPLQAAVAYDAYRGYPGYGEMLAGLGGQINLDQAHRFQLLGQLMAGTNVHGRATKASAGLRYTLSDRLALNLASGRIQARNAAGQPFSADSLSLGLEYRFAMPIW